MSAPSIIWPESIKYNFSISDPTRQPPEADGAVPEACCWLYYGRNLGTKLGIRRQIFDCPHLSNCPRWTPPAVVNIGTHHHPHLTMDDHWSSLKQNQHQQYHHHFISWYQLNRYIQCIYRYTCIYTFDRIFTYCCGSNACWSIRLLIVHGFNK